jgi:hypothetical protein
MKQKLAELCIILTVAVLACGCGLDGKDGAPGLSVTGPQGPAGETGPAGADGKDASSKFEETGNLGLYQEQTEYTGDKTLQLTCMQGESTDADMVVLRIRSKTGGLLQARKAGSVRDAVYLPAGLEVFLYSVLGNGTYVLELEGSSQTKACSPL